MITRVLNLFAIAAVAAFALIGTAMTADAGGCGCCSCRAPAPQPIYYPPPPPPPPVYQPVYIPPPPPPQPVYIVQPPPPPVYHQPVYQQPVYQPVCAPRRNWLERMFGGGDYDYDDCHQRRPTPVYIVNQGPTYSGPNLTVDPPRYVQDVEPQPYPVVADRYVQPRRVYRQRSVRVRY